jgi:hypothetical protein
MPSVGVGTVSIPILKHKFDKGKDSQDTITLRHVLHTPSGICNILDQPFLIEMKGGLSFAENILLAKDGSVLCVFEDHPKRQVPSPFAGLMRLKLQHT